MQYMAFGDNELKFLPIIDKNAFPDYEEPQTKCPNEPKDKYLKLLGKTKPGSINEKIGAKTRQ